MRLLTVNIHKGVSAFKRRTVLHGLRDAVRAVCPDVLLLQEVEGPSRQPMGASDATVGAQYEFLADQIWTDHAYGRNAVADGLDHGNAVLSRWPVLHSHNHDVSLPGHEPRGLLHCELAQPVGAPSLHVICVHLGLKGAHRHQQMLSLCDIVARQVPDDAPLVVAGDFNDWRQRADAVLRPIGLTEVYRQVLGRHARSFPAFWPLLRLDRIYVRGVGACRPVRLPLRLWARLSDHLPLAVDIDLPSAP